MAKVIEYGANKPLHISLPDKYWDVLFAMAQMEGREVEEYAQERLQQIIIEDVIFDEEGDYGRLLRQGWKETLKDDPYFKDVCGCKREGLQYNKLHARRGR